MKRVTCEKCIYWYRTEASSLGECRRFPPVLDKYSGSIFPKTSWKNWCGEGRLEDPIEIK